MNLQQSTKLRLSHYTSVVLHHYADWRIGATSLEKHCYKTSDTVLLTFDDYGSVTQVNEILAILSQHRVKAMFFLQGDWAEKNPQLVRKIAAAGHVVGNHSVTHPILFTLKPDEITQEISHGLPGPWFRPPQGRYNDAIRTIAHRLGFVICYWTIDSRDWAGTSVAEMRHTILSELKPGAVILFHLHGAHTRELLPTIIADIRAKGLELTPPTESWQLPATYL
jgi:peptidoglycan/xylan/chitin deacetylase (PgdA/CDA1 family)